jgi:hypothetical protein
MPVIDDDLAKIIRPIVEGQIRSFIHSHPNIVKGVDWRFSQDTREEALVASIAKRVNRDLLSEQTRLRLAAVLGTNAPSSQTGVDPELAPETVDLQPGGGSSAE